MNPLKQLHQEGQSVWLDYIRRSFIESGELKQLVNEDGLRGITSNPKIFMKAITGSDEYDQQIRQLIEDDPHIKTADLYEAIAITDIRAAADVLRDVFDQTEGGDGFVSLEVSPNLAYDTDATIGEARRLWKTVDRPNILIKVPATQEGIPAIETLLAEGININITLMFSMRHYEAVAQAYLRALERAENPARVSSVASFFLSRITRAVDQALDEYGSEEADSLKGKIAIANAKVTYERFRQLFDGPTFQELRARGARVQRVLWASTSTKNPDYSDVLYVTELIGPDTVNTMPPKTLNAFRDHGQVSGATVLDGIEQAHAQLENLAALEISLDEITEKLQKEGVKKFQDPFDQLFEALEEKRTNIETQRVACQTLRLAEAEDPVQQRLDRWQDARFAARLWRKDPTLWFDEPREEISDRLGWLDLPPAMHAELDELNCFATELKQEGIKHLVLLGMGGSSLAPEVFARTFGSAAGYPELIVLDSTHPKAVQQVERAIDLPKTHFLVSSKSGTTIETLSLFRYLFAAVGGFAQKAGKHFSAVTDPGTPLEKLAVDRKFRRAFRAPADLGGRYSALSQFGLVPAAAIGMDVHEFLDRAWTLTESCAFCVPASKNPALRLGAALGELAHQGRDKLTIITTSSLSAFPDWLEQLLAESTGKDNTGIVPVVGESLSEPDNYADDRTFVYLKVRDDSEGDVPRRLQALEKLGHPVIEICLRDKYDLSQEMFRWEMAVAAAGAALGVHPFNQPNVESAKQLAREAMQGDCADASEIETLDASAVDKVSRSLSKLISEAQAGSYFAIQAYVAPTTRADELLQEIRRRVGRPHKMATSFGYGPRFLHSIGQLHKGGPNTGLFLQIVDESPDDLPVPEADFTFRQLIQAQARGDYQALAQRGRRILRVNVGEDAIAGLKQLAEALA
ncbi:MAG: bifunctional transaldolase/phosoglucose isomerase [Pirellulaceae bacterium]